ATAQRQHGVLHLARPGRCRGAVRSHGRIARRQAAFCRYPGRTRAKLRRTGPGTRISALHSDPVPCGMMKSALKQKSFAGQLQYGARGSGVRGVMTRRGEPGQIVNRDRRPGSAAPRKGTTTKYSAVVEGTFTGPPGV